jgi:hypothetical protein
VWNFDKEIACRDTYCDQRLERNRPGCHLSDTRASETLALQSTKTIFSGTLPLVKDRLTPAAKKV